MNQCHKKLEEAYQAVYDEIEEHPRWNSFVGDEYGTIFFDIKCDMSDTLWFKHEIGMGPLQFVPIAKEFWK